MKLVVWCAVAVLAGAADFDPDHDPLLADAHRARDRADVSGLHTAIEAVAKSAQSQMSADAYIRLAILDLWLCEAAHAHDNTKLIKQAAQEGVGAAEHAVKLNAQSSEAHRLQGELLAELIPYAFAGGMRYGPRLTRELDRAIELDPQNINAHIARAVAYFYTPGTFGGNRPKAIEEVKKAIEAAPASDLAHIRLAQFYLAMNQREAAGTEISAALRLNPDRSLARSVAAQLAGSK